MTKTTCVTCMRNCEQTKTCGESGLATWGVLTIDGVPEPEGWFPACVIWMPLPGHEDK